MECIFITFAALFLPKIRKMNQFEILILHILLRQQSVLRSVGRIKSLIFFA